MGKEIILFLGKEELGFLKYTEFSLFISTTGKRVFQSGRALAGNIADYNISAQYIVWNTNLPHFSPLRTNSFPLTSL